MEWKLMLIRLLSRVPEKLLPARLKNWMDREMSGLLAEMDMEVNQSNWRLVQLYGELKALAEDPRVPEEKRESIRQELADVGRKMDEIGKRKAELDEKAKEW